MAEQDVSGVLVVDERDQLVGHAYRPRYSLCHRRRLQPITELMTPRERLITAAAGIDTDAGPAPAG